MGNPDGNIAWSGKRPCLSRADLICLLDSFGEERLAGVAPFFGYQLIEKKEKKPIVSPFSEKVISPQEPPSVQRHFVASESKLRFYRVTQYRKRESDEVRDIAPPWWREVKPLQGPVQADPAKKPPPTPPLIPWSRLWPFVRKALGDQIQGSSIDIDLLIAHTAQGKPIRTIPYRKKQGWARTCQIVLDCDDRLQPFWHDLWKLFFGIKALRGVSNLEVLVLEEGPDRPCRNWQKWLEPAKAYQFPEPETPILIVSDLGLYEASKRVRQAWIRFGRRLKKAGFSPVVLTPTPPRLWDEEIASYFRLACWDRGERLPHLGRGYVKGTLSHTGKVTDAEKGKTQLLSLLSAAIRVEPGLLRAVRQMLPCDCVDVGTEAEVWHHQDTLTTPIAFAFVSERLQNYRDSFSQEEESIQKKVIQCIRQYHAHLSPSVLHEESLLACNLVGLSAEAAREHIRSVAKRLSVGDFSYQEPLMAWIRRLFGRQHSQMWEQYEELAAAWAIMNKEDLEKGNVDLPPGIDIEKVVWILSTPGSVHSYIIRRRGNSFVVSAETSVSDGSATEWADAGSPVAKISSTISYLEITYTEDNQPVNKVKSLHSEHEIVLPVPEGSEIKLKTDQEEVTLNSLEKPSWAQGIGRDQHGLFVIIEEGERSRRAYWFNPGNYTLAGATPDSFHITEGFYWDEEEYQGLLHQDFLKPSWADGTGVDKYGLYADFSFKGIVQRMRWIRPGVFVMGSPKDEPERFDNEVMHEVVLTRGFWLAETACTQALWEVVMGENPASFKGSNRPVENVSWNDVQKFIKRINSKQEELHLRLPTEAEWEYACRAGTTTPFWFGENITPEQVNYHGNYPYAGGNKGKYRGETVEVKSLPCNDWGLYEMHGNVLEWCADWYGDYPSEPVVDPNGTDKGDYRVLRGGGWNDDGRDVRSALRHVSTPDDRFDYFGFRLARGQK